MVDLDTDRIARRDAFLAEAGWGDATIAPLADDASFRRYDRLNLNGTTAVLMDAPPPHEDVRPFVSIGRFIKALDLSAPDILAEDPDGGFLLLEDLGDATFTRVLADPKSHGVDENGLYAAAADTLATFQYRAMATPVPDGVRAYDPDVLMGEALLLPDWYVPAVRGEPCSDAERQRFIDAWSMPFEMMKYRDKVMVLRDFHVDNLVWLPERDGPARTGLLDFQDALAGHPSYDLMSLVEDARRDVSNAIAETCRSVFFDRLSYLRTPDFDAAFAALAAGRHAKVIGIFTRLCVRDGKGQYLDHIPRCWQLLESHLDHPSLKSVKAWFDGVIPTDMRVRPTP